MGNNPSKSEAFMMQRERINTEHRKQGTLSVNLVREEFNRDIQEVYDLKSGELLGKGGFGTVREVTHRATQIKYALKTIELKDVETHEQYEFLLNEIEIMKKLDHPNIARVQEVFHTPDHYYMVMDLYTGGDMYARYKFRSEDDTAKIVNKLINALRYCHDRNVAHRDIKLENICFESMADDAEVKLVDFGLSASFKDEQLRHDLVGSWAFMAPEVLQRAHHPQACDLWSMGVVTYCLLVGFPPFRAVNLKHLKEQILYGKVTFAEAPWRSVSDTAKDFILKLLRKDPSKRLTAQQAQQHPWLSNRPRSKWGANAKLSPEVVENLRHFKNLNLMKRVALGVVARTLEPSEMRDLEQEFHKADKTKSGVIAIDEFRDILLQSKQFPKREVDEIFDGVDIGSSGLLSYTDFTAAALDRQDLDTRRLRYAFERLDHDNNGTLDYEDLMMTVGSDLTSEDVRIALKQFDPSGDGKVTFEAFCKGMRSAGPLDALATAQLTSGHMVDRIAKGEGKEAIQQTLTEFGRHGPTELLSPGVIDATEGLPSPAEQQRLGEPAAPEGFASFSSPGMASVELPLDGAGGAVPGMGMTSVLTESMSTFSRNSESSASKSTPTRRPHSMDVGSMYSALHAARQQVLAGGGTSLAALREGALVGGGVEATAPSPRKWSKEASPDGGGRADALVRDNGGGEALPVIKMDLAGVGIRASLAERRLQNSIRLRGGLGSIFTGGVGAAGLGITPSVGTKVEAPSQPRKAGGATGTGKYLGASEPKGQSNGGVPGKSGGKPAGRRFVAPSRKKMVVEEDLPPKDSTAGEVDLGWGSQGPPPDLAGPPSSCDGSNVSCGSNGTAGSRTPRSLRFGGVTGNGKRGDGKKRPPGGDKLCANGGRGGTTDDMYRNFDGRQSSGDMDWCGGARGRRRTAGVFCVPGNARGDDEPPWAKWVGSIFKRSPG